MKFGLFLVNSDFFLGIRLFLQNSDFFLVNLDFLLDIRLFLQNSDFMNVFRF